MISQAQMITSSLFYCPFTGELLVLSDPYNGVEDFPKTVIAVLTEHCSQFVRDDFDESDFGDFEGMEDLCKILEKKVQMDSWALIVELGYYGNHSGDYSLDIYSWDS